MRKISRIIAGTMMAAAALVTMCPRQADACTRVIYKGADSLIVIGRSLDWKTPIPTNVYVYPRGIAKKGSDAPGAITWTSRYGAVYAVGYDAGVTEGMNECGLSVNGLFCRGTIYSNASNSDFAPMSLAVFPAWILDMCATTDEAVDMLQNTKFTLSGAEFDGGTATALHFGITDRTGNTVVVEYDQGVMNIYPAGDMQAMTNDPTWPQMCAIVAYWEKIGGKNALPGTVSSPDRCTRAQFFVTNVDKTADADLGATITRTVLYNCSVPYTYGVGPGGEPNLSMTQWRSYSNLRDLRYYFELSTAQGFYYIDLGKIDLRPGAPVLKLQTEAMQMAVGDQTGAMFATKPFTPMY